MSKSIPIGNLEETSNAARQVRRDAAENRELILRAAKKLFDEKGVAATNMADIAQAASVGKGTLYRRFANKGELCLAIMDAQMLTFQESALERMRQMTASNVPKMEQLDRFLDSLVYFIDAHVPLLCEVQRLGLSEDIPGQQRPHFWQHMTVSGLLHGAISSGELPPGLDVTYVSDAILATLKADLFRFQREGRNFSLERISRGLRTLVAALQS